MLAVFPFILVTIGIAFAADVLGMIVAPLGLLVALLLLALAMAADSSGESRPVRLRLLALALPAIAAGLFVLGLAPDERVNRLLSMAVLAAGAGIAFRAFGRPRRMLYVAALASFFCAVFFLILRWSPPAWFAWNAASLGVSRLVGRALGRSLALAPSYSGFNVTALVALSAFAIHVSAAQRSWRRLGFAMAWLLAALLVYICVMAFVPSPEAPAAVDPAAPAPPTLGTAARHLPWNMPALVFMLQLPALWIAGRAARLRPMRMPPRGARDIGWAASLGLLTLAAAAALVVRAPEPAPQGANAPPPRVLLYEHGFVNWVSPDYHSFGQYSSGMLGRLPALLRAFGMNAVVAPALDDNALAGACAVVLFTPVEPLDRALRDRLYEFVARGGSLLLVAEHTWRSDSGADPFNDLLEPTDIRVKFDSAHYQIGGWLYGFGFAPGPLYAGMRQDLNEPGVGIGASLALGPRARPLLWGTAGYSDVGSPVRTNVGFLGDSRYTPGEQLGDIVLAADQPFGKGRVVVLGDTTPFFNLLAVNSWEMTARLFTGLCSPPRPRYDLPRLAVALALLTGALAVYVVYRRRSVLPVILLALAVAALLRWQEARDASCGNVVPSGRVAIIDASHAQAFSRDTWRDEGLAGLCLNLMRNDVQPFLVNSMPPAALSRAPMLFIISPLRTFTDREAQDVRRFVASGGTAVVSVDPRGAEAVAPLLQRFGLRVRNMPLGPFMTNLIPAEISLRLRVGYVVESTGDGDAQVLAAYEDPKRAAVMVEKRLPGARPGDRGGSLILIGDGQFFHNVNLEPDKGPPIMENVQFVRWLVQHAFGDKAAGATP